MVCFSFDLTPYFIIIIILIIIVSVLIGWEIGKCIYTDVFCLDNPIKIYMKKKVSDAVLQPFVRLF